MSLSAPFAAAASAIVFATATTFCAAASTSFAAVRSTLGSKGLKVAKSTSDVIPNADLTWAAAEASVAPSSTRDLIKVVAGVTTSDP